MRKGSRLTFGHLSYVASYKHPTARKSAAGAAISWRVRPSVIGVEYALIVVCRVTASVCLHPAANLPRNGRMLFSVVRTTLHMSTVLTVSRRAPDLAVPAAEVVA
jgi:hypothetical protein